MASNLGLSKSEGYDSEKHKIRLDIYCERCSKSMEIPNRVIKKTVSHDSSINCKHSSQLLEPIYEVHFTDNNFQVIAESNLKDNILRPHMSRSDDLGKINIDELGLLSNCCEVEHPVCVDCTDNILDYIDQEVESAEDDIEKYSDYLSRHEREEDDDNIEEIQAVLQRLEEKEALLQEQLFQLETEKKEKRDIIRDLNKECETLENEMDKQCKKRNEIEGQCLEYEDNCCSLDHQIFMVKSKIEPLQENYPFKIAFRILLDPDIAVINGYRLGRLPNIPVSWKEINKAWGQAILLLHSLSKLINFSLENCQLLPMSDHSFIKMVKSDEVKLLPLFYSGNGKDMKQKTEFDEAMFEFLNYLRKFKEKIDESQIMSLPHPIQNRKIIDTVTGISYSIRLTLNTEKNWTLALKFVLRNLSWAIAWSSKITESI